MIGGRQTQHHALVEQGEVKQIEQLIVDVGVGLIAWRPIADEHLHHRAKSVDMKTDALPRKCFFQTLLEALDACPKSLIFSAPGQSLVFVNGSERSRKRHRSIVARPRLEHSGHTFICQGICHSHDLS